MADRIPALERFFQRRFILNLLLLVLFGLGGWAWWAMPVEMSPVPELPVVTVSQSWAKTSAVVMEEKITRGMESIAYRLPGVEGVRSITREGVSTVIITFGRDEPVEFRVIELREQLYEFLKPLPLSAPPILQRSLPEELKQEEWFMRYTLRYDGPREGLQHYLKTVIQPGLLGLEGMAGVELTGWRTEAIQVRLLPHQLRAYHLEASEVMAALRRASAFSGSSNLSNRWSHHPMTIQPNISSLEDLKSFPIPVAKRVSSQERASLETPTQATSSSETLLPLANTDSSNPLHATRPSNALPTVAHDHSMLRLDQIADLSLAELPPSVIYRVNGLPSYGIYLYKVPGYDALRVSQNVQAVVQEMQASLPKGMLLKLEADTAETLRKQLVSLQQQAFMSVCLLFICLWAAYKRWKAPFIVVSSVVLTLCVTAIGMFLFNLSIHLVTLSALMISIGMVVDNAILVYDQLHRVDPQAGGSARKRLQALQEVVTPILGSTLTTVVIVLPLLFSLGSISLYLSPLVLTLTLALVISAVVSLVLVPHLLNLTQVKHHEPRPTASEPARDTQPTTGQNQHNGYYHRKRNWVLALAWHYYVWRRRFRYYVIVGFVLLIGIPVYLIPEPAATSSTAAPGVFPPQRQSPQASQWPTWIQTYFQYRQHIDPWIGGLGYRFYRQTYFGQLPTNLEEEHLRVTIKPPLGTPLALLDEITTSFEQVIQSYSSILHQWETLVTETGGSSIAIRLKPAFVHHPASATLKNELMQRAAYTGNLRIAIHGLGEGYLTQSSQTPASFWIRIRGHSFDELRRLAGQLQNALKQDPKVLHVETHQAWQLTDRGWQYVLDLDPEAMLHHQLHRAGLLTHLEDQIQPRHLSLGVLTMAEKTLPIYVYAPPRSDYLEAFMSLRVDTPIPFDLSSVATLKKEQVMPRIEKEDQSYSLVLGVDFMGSYAQGNAVISNLVQAFPRPLGFAIEQIHQREAPQKQKRGLNEIGTLLLAMLCVWMVVAALFNDLKASIKVLAALPLSALGIMSATVVHQIPFDRGAVAGTLLCIGIVVNNSILLVHRGKEYQRIGLKGFRAWIQVYRSSLRSILLTSGTTLLGLIPVLVWGEAGFWYHMAVVVSWGLTYSVVLLLALSGMMTR